jgi:hypothetical protein
MVVRVASFFEMSVERDRRRANSPLENGYDGKFDLGSVAGRTTALSGFSAKSSSSRPDDNLRGIHEVA